MTEWRECDEPSWEDHQARNEGEVFTLREWDIIAPDFDWVHSYDEERRRAWGENHE